MLKFRDQYRKNITYSQNGEEGILIEVFTRLGIDKGTCAEFGAHNGKFCSNTRYFLENGWVGTLIEASPALSLELIDNTRHLRVKVITNTFVTPENVNRLLPPKLDLLSIDCDGPDYDIWEAYTGHAKVVVIEINSSYPPDSIVRDEGTSYKPMVELGAEKGYKLIAHTGNLVFVANEYAEWFPDVLGHPIKDADLYFDKSFM
jgi:hypothetical protein